MRCELEYFKGVELEIVYLARRLNEALKVEMALTAAELDYYVEPGPYRGGFLFPRELTGAYFYVLPADVERARAALVKNNYKPVDKSILQGS